MKTASASPADLAAAGPAPSRRTVDAATRTFHALLALCFVGAYLSAESERWKLVHVTLGYSMAGLLVFRIVWGLVGPRPVRFAAWVSKLKGLPALWTQARTGALGAVVKGTQAQNLAMTLAVIGLLATVALTTASGWLTYEELTGDWVSEVHELAGNLLLALVLGHIALVLGLSVLRRRNLAGPMLTGRTPGRGPDLVQRNFTGLAMLLLVAVLAFWAWQWQTAPGGSADLAGTGAPALSARGHDEDDDD
jgi:cytochrome b